MTSPWAPKRKRRSKRHGETLSAWDPDPAVLRRPTGSHIRRSLLASALSSYPCASIPPALRAAFPSVKFITNLILSPFLGDTVGFDPHPGAGEGRSPHVHPSREIHGLQVDEEAVEIHGLQVDDDAVARPSRPRRGSEGAEGADSGGIQPAARTCGRLQSWRRQSNR